MDVIRRDWSHSCLQALGLWSPWSRPPLHSSVQHNIKHCWRRVWKPSSSIRTLKRTAKEGCISVRERTEWNVCECTCEITQVLRKVSVRPVCTRSVFDHVLLPTIPGASGSERNERFRHKIMSCMIISAVQIGANFKNNVITRTTCGI